DELRVAPDLHARPDLRVVLREPVVVAGDRPGTDVGLRPDLAVAEVSEMVRLRPRAEHRLLGLDEVPEVHALGKASAGPQACERPDHRVGAHLGFLDHRGESNVDPVTDDGVDEVRSAVDATAGAEARP